MKQAHLYNLAAVMAQLESITPTKAPSAERSPESAAPLGALASATCSLPVESVERLLAKWEARARGGAIVMGHNPSIGLDCGIAIAATQRCLDDLRAEMEAATVRQPAENDRDVPTGGTNGESLPHK